MYLDIDCCLTAFPGTYHVLSICRLGVKATTHRPLLVLDAGLPAAVGAASPPHWTTSVLHLLRSHELFAARRGSGHMLLAVLVYTGSQPTGIPVSPPSQSRFVALDCLPFLVCFLAVLKKILYCICIIKTRLNPENFCITFIRKMFIGINLNFFFHH